MAAGRRSSDRPGWPGGLPRRAPRCDVSPVASGCAAKWSYPCMRRSRQRAALDREGARAAQGALPLSLTLDLDDGVLVCNVYENSDGRVVVEFRATAEQLRQGWVRFTLTASRRTTRTDFVPLEADIHAVL